MGADKKIHWLRTFCKSCFKMLRNNGKKRLSKNVLEMKFMKRTKERTAIEIENEERQTMFADFISDAMKHQGSRFIAEPSYVNIENLTFGRMAFNGMNPEIEKMAEEERLKVEEAEATKREKDVQDEEMAEFYMASTISKKFASKRNVDGSKGPVPILLPFTPPAIAGAATMPGTSNISGDNEAIVAKGQKYVQGMRQQNYTWKKDQQYHKRRKMMKPS